MAKDESERPDIYSAPVSRSETRFPWETPAPKSDIPQSDDPSQYGYRRPDRDESIRGDLERAYDQRDQPADDTAPKKETGTSGPTHSGIDGAVLAVSELLFLLFGLPFGDDLYHDKPIPPLHWFYLALAVTCAIGGPMWPTIRNRWASPAVAASIANAARDERIWIATLLIFFLYGVAPDIYRRATTPNVLPATVIHDPPTAEDIAKSAAPIQLQLDAVIKQRDVSIAERDSARRELANTRLELEASRKATRAPAQQMQADTSDGPLRWNADLNLGAMGTGHGLVMGAVYFRATNVSTAAVQLKDAYIVSGLTGAKLSLKANISYVGLTPVAEINPIPPNATVDLGVEWKDAAALPIKDFLGQWGNIYLRVDYDQTVYERTYDSDYLYQKAMREFPSEGLGPRVTKKGEK